MSLVSKNPGLHQLHLINVIRGEAFAHVLQSLRERRNLTEVSLLESVGDGRHLPSVDNVIQTIVRNNERLHHLCITPSHVNDETLRLMASCRRLTEVALGCEAADLTAGAVLVFLKAGPRLQVRILELRSAHRIKNEETVKAFEEVLDQSLFTIDWEFDDNSLYLYE